MLEKHADILILGAGAAGLQAAHCLREAGIDVAVLEARDRVGGRIWTRGHRKEALEAGAEFVHEDPKDLFSMLTIAGTPAENVEEFSLIWDGSKLVAAPESQDQVSEILDAIPKAGILEDPSHDCTFAEFLKGFSGEAAKSALEYIEGFHAADAAKIGIASLAEDAGDPKAQQLALPLHGYGPCIEKLGEKIEPSRVFLNTIVERIDWSQDRVVVKAKTPEGEMQWSAPQAIVTFPLSILKTANRENPPLFHPPLDSKREALNALEMGHAVRVALAFDSGFWWDNAVVQRNMEEGKIFFVHASSLEFPTWWFSQIHPHRITAWVGGPRTQFLSQVSETEVLEIALRNLSSLFHHPIETLRAHLHEHVFHDWSRDPFARGAYSYSGVGAGEARRELARPLGGTLFFAGEATDFENQHSSVQGALESGRRAATEILAYRTQSK